MLIAVICFLISVNDGLNVAETNFATSLIDPSSFRLASISAFTGTKAFILPASLATCSTILDAASFEAPVDNTLANRPRITCCASASDIPCTARFVSANSGVLLMASDALA